MADAPKTSKRKGAAVDDAFERLFGYPWGTRFDLTDEELMEDASLRLLVGVFGRTRAARILQRREGQKRRKVEQPRQEEKEGEKEDLSSIVIPRIAPKIVTETKVFAGQAIQVPSQGGDVRDSLKNTPISMGPSDSAPVGGVGGGGGGGLDDVLAQMNGPSKMSAVAKTSNDWESFKQTDKGLQEDLERKAQSKDAYLVKQDFLKRVDNRKFELERAERDRERARRGN